MKARIQTTFFIFIVLFSLVAAKAFYIQVVKKEKLLSYARSQFMRETKEYPNRGSILDRNGTPLAINVQTWNMFTFPRKKGADYQNQLRQLSKIVPAMPFNQLWSKVRNREKYTWLARKVRLSEKQVDQIKKLDAIHLEAHSTRVYPNHELAAQILGFTGVDNSGLSGIERFKNDDLRGEAQLIRYHRDAKGRPVKYEAIETLAKPADDIVLAIDKELQSTLENALKEAVLHHKAFRGGASVMDAETGEILAMGNWPSFDPNDATDYPVEQRKLAFVTDPFEPGSIFKTLTIASALEHKVASPEKKYFCEHGQMRVQNHIINEAEVHEKFEWLTMAEILKFSSNVGTTKIAFDLTFPKLQKTLQNFKIGEKTGIEISGESKGILTKEARVRPIQLSNMSFGHGVATTAIQMMRVYAAIANKGVMVQPTILKSQNATPQIGERVISEKIADQLTKMLVGVVEEGTGKNAKIPHYTIAGKTGTAQRVAEKGGYDGHIASFIGYPVNVGKPFVVMVYIDNPKANGYTGNQAATPVFKKITQYLLYKKKDFVRFAHYNPESNAKNLDSVTSMQASNRQIVPGRMPNFVGMDKASAIRLAESLGIQMELTGFGVVSKQNPSVGSPLAGLESIQLHFNPPLYEE